MGEIWYTYKDIELIVAVVFGKRGKGWIKAIIAEHAAAGLNNFAGHIGCCPQGHFVLKKAALCRLSAENAQTPIQSQGQLLFQNANHRQ